MTQKVADVLKPREAYLLFLGKGGGSTEEFEFLPRPLNAGEDVLYGLCMESMEKATEELPAGNIFEVACTESRLDAVIDISGGAE